MLRARKQTPNSHFGMYLYSPLLFLLFLVGARKTLASYGKDSFGDKMTSVGSKLYSMLGLTVREAGC